MISSQVLTIVSVFLVLFYKTYHKVIQYKNFFCQLDMGNLLYMLHCLTYLTRKKVCFSTLFGLHCYYAPSCRKIR